MKLISIAFLAYIFYTAFPLLDNCADIENWMKYNKSKVDSTFDLKTYLNLPDRMSKKINPWFLGQGGFGKVFTVDFKDPKYPDGIKGVVKVIEVPKKDENGHLQLLRNELKYLNNLSKAEPLYFINYWGCAKSFEKGKKTVFIFSEKLDYSLDSYTHYHNDFKNMHFPDRMGLFLMIIRGFLYLQSLKVAHLDLKPANLMILKRNGTVVVKIIDYGFMAENDDFVNRGTKGFCNPCAENDKYKVTSRSDIYSLAVTFEDLLRTYEASSFFSECRNKDPTVNQQEKALKIAKCYKERIVHLKLEHEEELERLNLVNYRYTDFRKRFNAMIYSVISDPCNHKIDFVDFQILLENFLKVYDPTSKYLPSNGKNLLNDLYGPLMRADFNLDVPRVLAPDDTFIKRHSLDVSSLSNHSILIAGKPGLMKTNENGALSKGSSVSNLLTGFRRFKKPVNMSVNSLLQKKSISYVPAKKLHKRTISDTTGINHETQNVNMQLSVKGNTLTNQSETIAMNLLSKELLKQVGKKILLDNSTLNIIDEKESENITKSIKEQPFTKNVKEDGVVKYMNTDNASVKLIIKKFKDQQMKYGPNTYNYEKLEKEKNEALRLYKYKKARQYGNRIVNKYKVLHSKKAPIRNIKGLYIKPFELI